VARHEPVRDIEIWSDPWIPSSWMPTRPGRLFFLKPLAGPLLPDAH
jgi:hypothetical protein